MKKIFQLLEKLPGKLFFVLLLGLWLIGYGRLRYKTCLLASAAILVVWGIYILILWLVQRKGKPGKAAEQPEPEKVERLEERLTKAVEFAKDAPWYLVIGPSQCGKTTFLLNSGLEFSTIDALQSRPLQQGIEEETRNCDFFYVKEGTRRAILLDAAGRYITFGNESQEQEEWNALLELLKKRRKDKPIDGLIAAIDLPRLIKSDESGVEQQAKMIRDRMMEMIHRLRRRFPVYVVFTECDRLYGFSAFFGGLKDAERDQVWGATFRRDQQERIDDVFEQECKLLSQRLHALRLSKLAEEKPENSAAIYTFPLEFDAVYPKLTRFIGALFSGAAKDKPVLRGAYFTSGARGGDVSDLVFQKVARLMNHQAPSLPSGAKETIGRRGYFIKDLFEKVLFPDRALNQPTTQAERRNTIIRLGMCGVALIVFAVFALVFLASYSRSKGQINDANAYAAAVKGVLGTRRSTVDLEQLENLRKSIVQLEGRSLLWRSQRDDVARSARRLYLAKHYGGADGWEEPLKRDVEVPVKVSRLNKTEAISRSEPIKNAKVLAQVINGAISGAKKLFELRTNEDGVAPLKLNVEDGKLEVKFTVEHKEEGWETPQSQTHTIEPGQRLSAEVRFTFTKSGRLITVHCVDQFGQNLADAPVVLVDEQGEELGQKPTDDEGRAQFGFDAPAGRALRIRFGESEANFPGGEPYEFVVEAGKIEYTAPTQVVRRKIRTTVIAFETPTQAPRKGVSVSVGGASVGVTDANGQLETVSDAIPTPQNVTAEPATKTVKVNKNAAGGYDIVLEYAPAPVPEQPKPVVVRILTDAQEPLSDAEVWVYYEAGEQVSFEPAGEMAFASGGKSLRLLLLEEKTSGKGTLTLPREAEGRRLLLRHPNYWPQVIKPDPVDSPIQLASRNQKRALRDFDPTQQDGAEFYFRRAETEHQKENVQWQKVIADYKRALTLLPRKGYYWGLSAAYRDTEQIDASKAQAKLGAELNLDDPEHERYQSRLRRLLGD
jgi:hypothetical protein